MGDYETPLFNTDDQGLPQLPDLSSLFGAVGFPSFGNSDVNAGDVAGASANQSSVSPTLAKENSELQPNEDQCAMMWLS